MSFVVSLSFVFCFFFLMIRRPPRSTRTLSLHDALPISTNCRRYDGPGDQSPDRRMDQRDGNGSCKAAQQGENVYNNQHMKAQGPIGQRSEEHTSELQSLMRISYAVFCLKKKKTIHTDNSNNKRNR